MNAAPEIRKPVEQLSDEELFDELREQVNLSRNGPGHDRERTRAIACEATVRGWNLRQHSDA